jgi:PPOX class probable F420-dependent enzyme
MADNSLADASALMFGENRDRCKNQQAAMSDRRNAERRVSDNLAIDQADRRCEQVAAVPEGINQVGFLWLPESVCVHLPDRIGVVGGGRPQLERNRICVHTVCLTLQHKGISMIPDSHAELLDWDTKALAHVATIGPEGEPQSSPVWFDWDGTHVMFSLPTGRQKYRNLQGDKRISMSIVDPENAYRYLEIRGELAEIESDPNIDFISTMAKKYINKDRYPWHKEGDERMIMKIRPTKTSGMG